MHRVRTGAGASGDSGGTAEAGHPGIDEAALVRSRWRRRQICWSGGLPLLVAIRLRVETVKSAELAPAIDQVLAAYEIKSLLLNARAFEKLLDLKERFVARGVKVVSWGEHDSKEICVCCGCEHYGLPVWDGGYGFAAGLVGGGVWAVEHADGTGACGVVDGFACASGFD